MPNPVSSSTYDDSFRRLAKLQGGDPAFFVLAVHSFIEGLLRASCSLDDPADDSFGSFLGEFRSRLVGHADAYIPGLEVLGLIKQQHSLTNEVRHRFGKASVEDARAATQHLRRFCQLAKIPEGEGQKILMEYLKAWDDRRSYADLVKEVKDLGYRYQLAKNDAKAMTERVSALEAAQIEAEHLREQLRIKDRALADLEVVKGKKDERVDELRAERAALAAELKAAKAKAAAYDDAQAYLDALSRMTVLTRTRADYEKSIIRLTPEQKKVLEQIHLDSDFLVKGAAGTGKTLVLLKAIEKAKGGGAYQPALAYSELKGSIALLTYTTTLVKYDQYVSSLLSAEGQERRVATADAFLLERLRELDPRLGIDYHLSEELAKQFPAAGLSPKELAAEVENFIWGNDVSYDEYVLQGIERRGMKRPLAKEQRIAVWSSAEAMEAAMVARNTYTRNRAALLLAKAIAEGSAGNVKRIEYTFIDEAQDLPAAVLKALKACTNRCVLLAGDADQSIYQPGFSFKRAGLDIGGRTRILRTNFRNTVQLHEVAERYRRSNCGIDDENEPYAFRDGPIPELYKAVDADDMFDLLEKRITIFLSVLGYTPENICIVVPRDEDLQNLSERLSADGLSLVDIRGKGFSFSEAGTIRLTTMHSAKGLDFPVVLLYLPQFHVMNSSLDPATSDRMARNLIYVAMTRAMDHLNVFLREGTENPALLDLASCFTNPDKDSNCACEKEAL